MRLNSVRNGNKGGNAFHPGTKTSGAKTQFRSTTPFRIKALLGQTSVETIDGWGEVKGLKNGQVNRKKGETMEKGKGREKALDGGSEKGQRMITTGEGVNDEKSKMHFFSLKIAMIKGRK